MDAPGRLAPLPESERRHALSPRFAAAATYDYDVVSDADPNAHQRDEYAPSEFRAELSTSIPDDLKARLRTIAEPMVAGIPADGPDAIARRAVPLEAFLRDSGQFSYTLQMEVIDPSLDPVEDFLVNRKEGHCEYFASALALLLRSVDIPSRIVNGFKGGDWNDLTQTMNVRQKHAHSWVEAYVGPEPDAEKIPIWITLDPTPGASGSESIAQVGGLAGNFRPLTDVIRHIWVFYIVGYDGERQNRLLYAPMREMARRDSKAVPQAGTVAAEGVRAAVSFPDISSFISIRGFVVSFLACCLLAGLGHVAIRLWRLLLSGCAARARCDLAVGRAPLLPATGPDARRVRARADAGRNPERVRGPRTHISFQPRGGDPAGGGRPGAGRRRILSRSIRSSRARARGPGRTRRATGRARSQPEKRLIGIKRNARESSGSPEAARARCFSS